MKGKFWDILAWVILAGIGIWLILKVGGILKTPVIIEYAPLFGMVYLAGWAMHKLDRATEDINGIKEDIKVMESRTETTEKKIEHIEKDVKFIREKCPLFASKL